MTENGYIFQSCSPIHSTLELTSQPLSSTPHHFLHCSTPMSHPSSSISHYQCHSGTTPLYITTRQGCLYFYDITSCMKSTSMFRYSFITCALIPSMTSPALLPLRPPMIFMRHIQRIVLVCDGIRVLAHLPLGWFPASIKHYGKLKGCNAGSSAIAAFSVLCYICDMLIKIDASY